MAASNSIFNKNYIHTPLDLAKVRSSFGDVQNVSMSLSCAHSKGIASERHNKHEFIQRLLPLWNSLCLRFWMFFAPAAPWPCWEDIMKSGRSTPIITETRNYKTFGSCNKFLTTISHRHNDKGIHLHVWGRLKARFLVEQHTISWLTSGLDFPELFGATPLDRPTPEHSHILKRYSLHKLRGTTPRWRKR